ncbi:MAG: YdcH family protein [Pseudomonadota bacterium]
MSEARRVALERRHAELESELRTITTQPSGDRLAVVALKREKLKVKDELANLTN